MNANKRAIPLIAMLCAIVVAGCGGAHVQPGIALTFTIDGRVFATVTADKDGRADVERNVPLPGDQ